MPADGLMRLLHRLAEKGGLVDLIRRLDADDQRDAAGKLLYRVRHSAWFAFVVVLLSVVSAGTSLYPLGPVIVAATVIAPKRWLTVILGSSLGAVFGASCLALFIRSVGGGLVDAYFPEVRQHELWAQSAQWLASYGGVALAAIAASPLPQMPGMIAVALSDMGLASIALALLVGKTLKYTVYVLAILFILRAMRRVAEWDEKSA